MERRLRRNGAIQFDWADLPGGPRPSIHRVLCRAPLEPGALRWLRHLAGQTTCLETLAVVPESRHGQELQRELPSLAIIPIELAEWERAVASNDSDWLPLPLRPTPLLARFGEAELDRLARLEFIHQQALEIARLGGEIQLWLRDLEGTALAWLESSQRVAQLTQELAGSEADRAARLQVIENQGDELGRALGACNRLQAELLHLREQLTAAEADRAARLQVIQEQGARLGAAHGAHHCLEAEVATLRMQLAAAEADRAARLDVIHAQGAELDRLRTQLTQVAQPASPCAAR